MVIEKWRRLNIAVHVATTTLNIHAPPMWSVGERIVVTLNRSRVKVPLSALMQFED
jgi:hypothetical protein